MLPLDEFVERFHCLFTRDLAVTIVLHILLYKIAAAPAALHLVCI